MVLETKASLESGVIGAGHRFATTRLDAQRSTAGWVKEQMGGISYLFFVRKLAQRVDSEWDSVKVRPREAVIAQQCHLWRRATFVSPAQCLAGQGTC